MGPIGPNGFTEEQWLYEEYTGLKPYGGLKAGGWGIKDGTETVQIKIKAGVWGFTNQDDTDFGVQPTKLLRVVFYKNMNPGGLKRGSKNSGGSDWLHGGGSGGLKGSGSDI